ncbi:MAG: hypothetical protein RLZZ220_1662, partial [Pseudomonadota bacterium]
CAWHKAAVRRGGGLGVGVSGYALRANPTYAG